MKSRFVYEQHEEASKKLQKIRDYLSFLSSEISNSYGKSAKVTDLARQAAKAVDQLRFGLADELHEEQPLQLSMGALDFYQQQNNYPGTQSSDVDI